ncbi:MAG: dTDP-4-dehydrorhamnose reductase [Synergistaceae bacterium]|jgi:dTDP-4-dehydrorhamnose reductase|nr:dTDP-4-dehydrorhamnose reductase [Synergistaceae bacterium]
MQTARKMRIFLTGAYGQVGWELNRGLLPYGEILASDKDTLNLLDPAAVRRSVRDFKPNAIINAAAYTAVDKAETERDLCRKLNAEVPAILAEEAAALDAWMVHYSTDYVFNGNNNRPWTEDDNPDPVNFYGQSKLEGDMAVAETCPKHLIFRTSWVYASRGSNFPLTMLRLFKEKNELRIVDDQIGSPTWARYIAQATQFALKEAHGAGDVRLSGVYNLVASEATSWYNFACEIRDYYGGFENVTLCPVPSSEYPTPAARPRWSVLSSEKIERGFGIHSASWREAMRLCLNEIKGAQKTA